MPPALRQAMSCSQDAHSQKAACECKHHHPVTPCALCYSLGFLPSQCHCQLAGFGPQKGLGTPSLQRRQSLQMLAPWLQRRPLLQCTNAVTKGSEEAVSPHTLFLASYSFTHTLCSLIVLLQPCPCTSMQEMQSTNLPPPCRSAW